MFKNQLSIMFVGGPNTREDFHLNPSSELYYMMKGNMILVVMDAGRRREIPIREGQIFCLPAGVPHSPQRPEKESLGLVVERKRYEGELDGLRWYTEFESCDELLWEKLFQCHDLGKDLVPVVNAYKNSEQIETRVPLPELMARGSKFKENNSVGNIADPIDLAPWIDAHLDTIIEKGSLDLYGIAPSLEFSVRVVAHSSGTTVKFPVDTWVYQLRGTCEVIVDTNAQEKGDAEEHHTPLLAGECVTIPAHTPFQHISKGKTQKDIALSLVVQQHPQVRHNAN